jgi:hypothetical protein
MKRRNFFNSLAAFAGVASLSPQVFIPKFEPVQWKVILPNTQWIVAQWVGPTPEVFEPREYFLREEYFWAWRFVKRHNVTAEDKSKGLCKSEYRYINRSETEIRDYL